MVTPVYFATFSGHRPENRPGRTEAHLAATAPRLRNLFQALREKADQNGGELHLVSSLAAGADIIACETAITLGMPVHLALPKPEVDFLSTFRHESQEKDLSHWLPRARAILATIRPDPGLPHVALHPRHTIRVGAVSTTSPECYAEVNTRLLEPADLLVTLCNMEPSKSIAGTTHLISQARAVGIPTINLNPADPPQTLLPGIPDEFVNPQCDTLIPFTANQPHVTCDIKNSASPFKDLASCLGKAANDSSRIFRRSSAIAIIFHSLATILAAAVASYYYFLKESDHGMSNALVLNILFFVALAEFIFVGGGWYLEHRVHENKKQKTWLDCRFARELMRSMEKANPFLDPLYPEIQRHLPGWKRFAMTTALMLRQEQKVPSSPTTDEIEAWKSDYLKDRIKHQIGFFTKNHHEAIKPQKFFNFLTHKAALAALLFVFVALVIKGFDAYGGGSFLKNEYGWSALILLFLPILMPLLATVGASFGAVFDYGRRATRYHEMVDGLKRSARILPTLHTLPDITQLVRHTEETLLDENIEWLSAQKKGLGH